MKVYQIEQRLISLRIVNTEFAVDENWYIIVKAMFWPTCVSKKRLIVYYL